MLHLSSAFVLMGIDVSSLKISLMLVDERMLMVEVLGVLSLASFVPSRKSRRSNFLKASIAHPNNNNTTYSALQKTAAHHHSDTPSIDQGWRSGIVQPQRRSPGGEVGLHSESSDTAPGQR